MMINLLIDSNVLIYAMNQDSEYYSSAKSILFNSNYNFFITSKNISEFFAVAQKLKIPFQHAFDSYQEIKAFSKILFPSEKSLLIFEKLIQKYQPKGNQVFDIEIVSIMLDNGIDHIATFNRKDFINISEVELLKVL